MDAKFLKGLSTRAKAYLLTGECAKAVTDYTEVLLQKPKNGDALKGLPQAQQCETAIQRGRQQFTSRHHDGAKESFTEALSYAYESIVLLMLRCEVHMAQQDYQSVLVDTRQVLKTDNKHLEGLLLRGHAYYHMGDHDVAMQHYREGLRSDPEHKALKVGMTMVKKLVKETAKGDAALAEREYDDASMHYQAALTADPANKANNVQLFLKLAGALAFAKKSEEALGACNQAAALEPNNIDIQLKRGEVQT